MIWLVVILVVLLACFGGVLLFGAPYLPTLNPQVKTALKLAELKPGDTLIELGCGDGRVLIAAAQQGYLAIGYELNPILALVAWTRTRRYRQQVTVVWGNFWQAEWPPATVIFTFLLNRYMTRLDKRCQEYAHKPVRLISFAFQVPNKKPRRHQNGVYVYDYT